MWMRRRDGTGTKLPVSRRDVKQTLAFAAVLAVSMTTAIAPLSAQRARGTLAENIARVISRPEFRHAIWGIEFYALDAKRPVYTLNPDYLFTPASTTKLLTEGTALALLGADYRFRTRVYRTGPIAPDGTLDGDLVLVASGDPNLSGRLRPDGTLAFENQDHSYDADTNTRAVPGDPLLAIRALARQVGARVQRVRGHVIVDASLFPEGDRELGTGVTISPMVVNDNLVDVMLTPGDTAGAPLSARVAPTTEYVRFVNEAITGARDSRQAIRWAEDSTLSNGNHVVTIRGSMPAGRPTTLFSYAVPLPSRFAEVVFTEALRDAGVQAEARPPGTPPDLARLAASYVDTNVVATHESARLSEEVKVTLKVSQNLHASMTPLILGAVLGKQDTARTGFDLEREFLSAAGLDLTGAQQGDGAGGDAHFSPAFMVAYLAYMATRPDSGHFRAALPVLGRDGTLFDIQPRTRAAGNVFAKTGTYVVGDPLNRRVLVTGKGLAGYLTTIEGLRLAFAIYVNNVAVPDEPDAVKRIVGQALGEIAAAAYESRIR